MWAPSNVPAIKLAARLKEIAYPNLVATYFASGGAEADESAFKTARFYWKAKGHPTKVKIISRQYGYHGLTLAAMSATAVARLRQDVRAPGAATSSIPPPRIPTGRKA